MLKYIALFILLLLVIRYVRYLAEKLASPQGSGNIGDRGRNNVNVNNSNGGQNTSKKFTEGEYIDFEEIKE